MKSVPRAIEPQVGPIGSEARPTDGQGAMAREGSTHARDLLRGACMTLGQMSDDIRSIRVALWLVEGQAGGPELRQMARLIGEEHGLNTTIRDNGALVTVTFRRPVEADRGSASTEGTERDNPSADHGETQERARYGEVFDWDGQRQDGRGSAGRFGGAVSRLLTRWTAAVSRLLAGWVTAVARVDPLGWRARRGPMASPRGSIEGRWWDSHDDASRF